MRRKTFLVLLILTLTLTACGSRTSNFSARPSGTQSGAATGELSAALQVAIGTIKLDKTANEITKDQAAELLPLWETLQVLDSSDTAANQEKEALIQQIQETMTKDQMQAITSMNLTRQDMFSMLQTQGATLQGTQNGSTQSGTTRNTNPGGFVSGGGGFAGGPPPDGGGFPSGGPGFGGQNQTGRNQNSNSSQSKANRTALSANRIPTPLVQAVIDYLKKKAGG